MGTTEERTPERFAGIGSLEARILRALYAIEGWVGVHEVWSYLQDQKPVERGAVLTCLKRMSAKGLVEGKKGTSGSWEFRPTRSAQELAMELTDQIWRWLVDRPPSDLSRLLGEALMGDARNSSLNSRVTSELAITEGDANVLGDAEPRSDPESKERVER